jgi:hypothetical protein
MRQLRYLKGIALKAKVGPIRAGQYRAGKEDEKQQQDDAAAKAAARTAAPKTEPVLQPVKQRVEKKQFQQP